MPRQQIDSMDAAEWRIFCSLGHCRSFLPFSLPGSSTTMIACDDSVSLALEQGSLPDFAETDVVLLLPDGDRVRIEWDDDEPQIDAIVPMEEVLQ
jgi:hypothetical protein